MPPKSIAPSQLGSSVSTPKPGDEHLDSSYSSPLFSAKLQERLRQLDMSANDTVNSAEKAGGSSKVHKNALVHSIEVLSEDRRKTSELAREQALGSLLRIFVMKYDPELVNYDLFSHIVQSFVSSRTEVEASTALQLICVCTTMLEASGDPRSGDSLDTVNSLRLSLLKKMGSQSSVMVKQAIVTTFAILTYFMHAGGGGYGMDAATDTLMEVSMSVGTAEEAPVAAAALSGAALLATLLSPGSVAEMANDWLYSLLPMLEMTDIGTRLAATKFLAVLVEISRPSALFAGECAEASEEIIDTLSRMSQESVAKTAKRDKKVQNLLVKSVLKTCEVRKQLLTDDSEADESRSEALVSDCVLHYHRNTLSRSLGVNTWVALIVVEHLGWVFGPGLHVQLASNPYIKALLRKEEVRVENSISVEPEDGDGWREDDTATRATDSIKRSRDLRKRQLEKAEQRGLVD